MRKTYGAGRVGMDRLGRLRFGRLRERSGRFRGPCSVVDLLEVCRDIRRGELQFRLVGVGRWRTGRVSQADMTINADGCRALS